MTGYVTIVAVLLSNVAFKCVVFSAPKEAGLWSLLAYLAPTNITSGTTQLLLKRRASTPKCFYKYRSRRSPPKVAANYLKPNFSSGKTKITLFRKSWLESVTFKMPLFCRKDRQEKSSLKNLLSCTFWRLRQLLRVPKTMTSSCKGTTRYCRRVMCHQLRLCMSGCTWAARCGSLGQ